jgi:hypothetical protein
MDNQIILSLGPTGWNATFVGPHAASIKRLFDTDTLPLPFTTQANPDRVRADVEARNPGVFVSMA